MTQSFLTTVIDVKSDLPVNLLQIDERDIRRHGPGNILNVYWKQRQAEKALSRRGIHFRTTSIEEIKQAYESMTAEEFAAINGRQAWANWRTIPRSLRLHVPDRPLQVIDLGCGIGSSTQVLAFYCPAGSHIVGYEIAEPLVEIARKQTYPHRSGTPANVEFVCQGVTESLKQTNGQVVAECGVDVVNASGIIGHHMTSGTIQQLIDELCRVLRPAGIAMLDVGPSMKACQLSPLMRAAGFQTIARSRSWLLDPTGQLVFRRLG